jgi:hypothetical protein
MKDYSGEYEPPGLTQWRARCYFLDEVRRLKPEVLEELGGEPLSLFAEADLGKSVFQSPEAYQRYYETVWWQLDTEDETDVYVPLEAQMIALREGLRVWQSKWKLTESGEVHWLFERAVSTLFLWHNNPALHKSLVWEYGGFLRSRLMSSRGNQGYINWDEVSIRIEAPIKPPAGKGTEWDFLYERREEYYERLRALARKKMRNDPLLSLGTAAARNEYVDAIVRAGGKVDKYCEQVEEHFTASENWVKTKKTEHLQKYLIWAVRVRVLPANPQQVILAFDEIAEEEEQDVSTIRKRVKQAFTFIGLSPEPTFKHGRGRPKGRGDSKKRKPPIAPRHR